MIFRLIILLLCIASAGVAAAAASILPSTSMVARSEMGGVDNSPKSLFLYKDGVLSGDATNERLDTVLSALGRAAQLKAVLRYKPEAGEAVSFRVKDKVLAEALKEILRGYNYGYIPTAGSGEVSKLILLGKVSAEIAAPAPKSEPIQEGGPSAESESEGVKKKLAGPWGLDEFRRLKEFCKPAIEENEHSKPKTENSEECRNHESLLREEKLARALEALDTDYRNLKEAALNELKGINDPEATNALLDMALNSDDKELQQLAAEALWQHAADLGFKDVDANQALKVMAKEGGPAVKETGQQALEDAKRYAANIKEGGG